jgi:hypothetical protein
MGERNSIPVELQNASIDEGHELIAEAYVRLQIEGSGYVRLEDCKSLDGFLSAFAAAEEWEAFGLIQILESENEDCGEGLLIQPIRFRRLK